MEQRKRRLRGRLPLFELWGVIFVCGDAVTNALPSDARPKCDCPPHAVSPSQIDTYKKCPRRWGFRKLANRSEPETSSQKAGKAIHERLEKYALTGHLPHLDSDKYAKPVWAAVPHLPKPDPKHACEQHLALVFDGLVIHGYPDFVPRSLPWVVDYKTTSVQKPHFRYALTSEGLLNDTQALVYAYYVNRVSDVFPTRILLKWIYIERQPPYGIRVVQAEMPTGVPLEEKMSALLVVVKEMYAHREECDALGAEGASEPIVGYVNGLPANTDHCGAYGGCPHASVCTAYKPITFASLFKEKDFQMPVDLKALAANIRSGNNPNAANVGDTMTAQSAPASEPDLINSPVEDLDEDTENEIRKMEAAIEAKKKAAEKAKAAAKAKAEKAEKASKVKYAEGQESAEPASVPTKSGNFTIEIHAIASGSSLGHALSVLKENVTTLG